MRVRIIFILKNKGGYVPFHHQYLLAHLLKGIVMKGGDERYKSFTDYNFSGLKGQTKISRTGLHYYSSRVTLVLASPDQDFIDYVIRTLFIFPQVEVGNLMMVPEYVELEKQPELSEVSKYICISPIVILKPEFNDAAAKQFIDPTKDEFSDILYENTITRMAKTNRYSDDDLKRFNKFQVVPDRNYLSRIREGQKKFARIYPLFDQDIKYEVRGYTFPFTLYAEREVQEFVFNSGFGFCSHKGFGMLDIANADPTSRTARYEVEGVEMKYPNENVLAERSQPRVSYE